MIFFPMKNLGEQRTVRVFGEGNEHCNEYGRTIFRSTVSPKWAVVSPLEFDLSVVLPGFLDNGTLMHRQRLLPLTAETLVLVQQVRGKYKIIVLVTGPGDFAVTLYYVLNSISCHCIVMATSVLLDARKIFIFWNSHCSYLPVRTKGISAFYLRTAVSLSFLRNMSRRHDPHSPSSPALFLPQWQQEMVMRDSMLAWLLPFLSSFFPTPLSERADTFCLLQHKRVHVLHPRFSQLWAGSEGSRELGAWSAWSSWKEAAGAGLLPLGHSSSCPSTGTACLGHPPELLMGS